MNEQRYAAEPWRYVGERDGDFVIYTRRDDEEAFVLNVGSSCIAVVCVGDDPANTVIGFDTDLANARRIVACVNACAGMADPAAEIERLRAEVAKLDELTDRQAAHEHELACDLSDCKQALATCCCVAQDAAKAAAGYWPNDKCPAPAPKNE